MEVGKEVYVQEKGNKEALGEVRDFLMNRQNDKHGSMRNRREKRERKKKKVRQKTRKDKNKNRMK